MQCTRVMHPFWPLVHQWYDQISCNIYPSFAQWTRLYHMLNCIHEWSGDLAGCTYTSNTGMPVLYFSTVVWTVNNVYIWLLPWWLHTLIQNKKLWSRAMGLQWQVDHQSQHDAKIRITIACYCSWNHDSLQMKILRSWSILKQWVKLTHILQGHALQAALSFTHEHWRHKRQQHAHFKLCLACPKQWCLTQPTITSHNHSTLQKSLKLLKTCCKASCRHLHRARMYVMCTWHLMFHSGKIVHLRICAVSSP